MNCQQENSDKDEISSEIFSIINDEVGKIAISGNHNYQSLV